MESNKVRNFKKSSNNNGTSNSSNTQKNFDFNDLLKIILNLQNDISNLKNFNMQFLNLKNLNLNEIDFNENFKNSNNNNFTNLNDLSDLNKETLTDFKKISGNNFENFKNSKNQQKSVKSEKKRYSINEKFNYNLTRICNIFEKNQMDFNQIKNLNFLKNLCLQLNKLIENSISQQNHRKSNLISENVPIDNGTIE